MCTELTPREQSLLGDALTKGNITRSCPRSRLDWFNIRLSPRLRVCGAYKWGSERGEWTRLRVYRKPN